MNVRTNCMISIVLLVDTLTVNLLRTLKYGTFVKPIVHLFWQSKFGSFNQFSKTFNTDEFCYDDLKNTDFVFMRWKVLVGVLLTAM